MAVITTAFAAFTLPLPESSLPTHSGLRVGSGDAVRIALVGGGGVHREQVSAIVTGTVRRGSAGLGTPTHRRGISGTCHGAWRCRMLKH